jgi:hypothetical protein
VPEERALRLTLSQANRRLAARRRLLATRREQQVLDLNAAVNGTPEQVSERLAHIFNELEANGR